MKLSSLMVPAKLLFVAIFAYVVWQAWIFFRPRPREYVEAELGAIQMVCGDVADALAQAVSNKTVFGVAHFANDPSDAFTRTMKAALGMNPEWQVIEQSVIQKFLTDITKAVTDATSLEEVVGAGRRVGIDVIVVGRVVSVEETGIGARAEAQVHVYDARPGQWLLQKTVSQEWEPGVEPKFEVAPARKARKLHVIWRFLMWAGFVVLLPLATPFVTHWAVERKTNWASFGALAAYTAADVLVALLCSGFRLIGMAHGLGLVGALLVCAAYNYYVCERIAAR
ncbi:MAG: hypothetical protein JXR37_15335 [Kiritimatiellae bacterium]|nr:hypothetical protein [Kiritimatiellia bacterium]